MTRTAVAYLPARYQLSPGDVPARVRVGHTVVEDRPAQRAGLATALEFIARGRADVLLTVRLDAVAASLREVVMLLDWLGQHGASLIALDLGLDTASREGRQTHSVLSEVQRWAREPLAPRRKPGRPALSAVSPEVARRIVMLREQGLSLHAIADTLNDDRVPTPRGGARWRASSVQAALGYRRPHPPRPIAPPPSGPRPGHGKPRKPKP